MLRRRLLAGAALLWARAAQAQDDSFDGDPKAPYGGIKVQPEGAAKLYGQLTRPLPRGSRDSGVKRFAAPARTAAGRGPALPYIVTPQLRAEAAARFLIRIEQTTPAIAAVVAREMSRHAFGPIFAGIIRPFGLQPDDAGDVAAAYTVLGWLIATGAPDPAPAQVTAARAQIADEMARDPDMADKRTLTSLAEGLKLHFVILHAGWQSARRSGTLDSYSDAIAALYASQSGLDLRALRLTRAGFTEG